MNKGNKHKNRQDAQLFFIDFLSLYFGKPEAYLEPSHTSKMELFSENS